MIIYNLSTIKVHHRIHVNDKNFKTYQHYQIAKRLFKAETIEILKEANKEPYKNYSPSSTKSNSNAYCWQNCSLFFLPQTNTYIKTTIGQTITQILTKMNNNELLFII